jgi:hypothetical protein
MGHLVDCVLHQEADREDQVSAASRQRQVLDIIGLVCGFDHLARKMELVHGLGVADVGQVIEATIVQTTNIGDEGHRDGRLSRRGGGASATSAACVASPTGSQQNTK